MTDIDGLLKPDAHGSGVDALIERYIKGRQTVVAEPVKRKL